MAVTPIQLFALSASDRLPREVKEPCAHMAKTISAAPRMICNIPPSAALGGALQNRSDPDVILAGRIGQFFLTNVLFSQKNGVIDASVPARHQLALETGSGHAQGPDGFGGTGDGQTVNPAEPRAQFSV